MIVDAERYVEYDIMTDKHYARVFWNENGKRRVYSHEIYQPNDDKLKDTGCFCTKTKIWMSGDRAQRHLSMHGWPVR